MASIDCCYQNKTTKLTPMFDSNANFERDSCPSDCESGVSGGEDEQQFRCSDSDLIRIRDGEMIHETITRKLVSSLSVYGLNAQVEAIHRNNHSGMMSRAKLESFCIYSRAVETKCGVGSGNVKFAWFGASKNEIDGIIRHGFGVTTCNRTHGLGVYLSPVDHPIESMQSAVPDEDGVKHMLLCRVILGKMEFICPGSEQYNPSSEEFDSGVDDLVSPRKYVIWTSHMNTHILPEFVVSYRASSHGRGSQTAPQNPRKPNSDWMPFRTLITVLSKYLPCDAVELIAKHHCDFNKQKITRCELIQRVRHIAGDELLMMIIKSYRGKIKARSISGLSSLHQSNNRN